LEPRTLTEVSACCAGKNLYSVEPSVVCCLLHPHLNRLGVVEQIRLSDDWIELGGDEVVAQCGPSRYAQRDVAAQLLTGSQGGDGYARTEALTIAQDSQYQAILARGALVPEYHTQCDRLSGRNGIRVHQESRHSHVMGDGADHSESIRESATLAVRNGDDHVPNAWGPPSNVQGAGNG